MEPTDVGAVYKTKQIEQRDRRDDHEINLPAQSGFGLGIKGDERMAVSADSFCQQCFGSWVPVVYKIGR